jgi:hypothetical protein
MAGLRNTRIGLSRKITGNVKYMEDVTDNDIDTMLGYATIEPLRQETKENDAEVKKHTA